MEILLLFIPIIIIAVAIGKMNVKSPSKNERVEEPRIQQCEKAKQEDIINEKTAYIEEKEAENREYNILLEAQKALEQETNKERREFIQHIINTANLRQERRKICDYIHNDRNKVRYPDEYEEKSRLLNKNFEALKDINIKFSANYPKDVMNAYKKISAAFDSNLNEIWVCGEEHKTLETIEIELEDCLLSSEGIGHSFLGYYNPNFGIGDDTFYLFPMYAVVCKKDASKFELVNIEDVSVTYKNQEFKEKRHFVSSIETSRYIYIGEYNGQNQASIYSKEIISNRMYAILTIHPFEVSLYSTNLQKIVRILKAVNEYIDFIKSKKGLISEKTIEDVPKQDKSEITKQIVVNNSSSSDYNFDETIEISYTVFGYNRLGETTFDMEVDGKKYMWLLNAEADEGVLTSDYISENRPGLHKQIIRVIRKDMKEKAFDPDDGMVETYVSGVHRKEFYQDASYDYASNLAEDDDIEYTVTL